jgi:hypothetical protein
MTPPSVERRDVVARNSRQPTGAGGTVTGIGVGHALLTSELLTSRQPAVDVTDRAGRMRRHLVDVDERGLPARGSRGQTTTVHTLRTG